MIILALDPSLTRCGYAVLEAPPVRLAALITGSFQSDDVAAFGRHLHGLINQHRPDFVCSEEAAKVIFSYGKKQLLAAPMVTVNADQLKLPQIEGITRGLCEALNIPLALVPVRTWRGQVLGAGWGAASVTRPQAKQAARNHCAMLKVPAKNHDIAEAVCIGLWAAACQEFRWAAYQKGKAAS